MEAVQRVDAAPILSVRNLEVVYNDVALVLRGVSVDVPHGAIVALLGEQGTHPFDPNCRRSTPSPIDICTADLTVLAMTSPIYVEVPSTTTARKAKKPKGRSTSSRPPTLADSSR